MTSIFINLAREILSRLNITVLPRLVPAKFLGKEYTVRNGTVDRGDYDDAWMLALAYQADIIFDIGSNIGQSAFNMLHAPNVTTVVLVDPSPIALTTAADTLVRNRMGHRARFLCAFVSSTVGEEVQFVSKNADTGGHVRRQGESDASYAVHTVPTVTIDRVAELFGVVPALVKIDVAEYERQVMDGSVNLAAKGVTRFLIEMHDTGNKPQRQVVEEVLEWCRNNKYAAWYLKDASRLDKPDKVAHRGRFHLLLQPENWEYPANLALVPQSAPVDIVPPLYAAGPAGR